jgi:hypothetical protein
MIVLFATCVLIGVALLMAAGVWGVRTRHERRLWRTTHQNASKVAIVLELEERVIDLTALEAEERV